MYYIRHAIYRSGNGENLTKDGKFELKIEERSSISRLPLMLILLKKIFYHSFGGLKDQGKGCVLC